MYCLKLFILFNQHHLEILMNLKTAPDHSSILPTLILQAIPRDYDSISKALVVANMLSIIGCVSNLLITLILRKYSDVRVKMIIAICIADFVFGLFSLLLNVIPATESLCLAMTYFSNIGFLGSLVWTCSFAYYYYTAIVVEGSHMENISFKKYAAIGFVVPVCLATALACFQKYIVDDESKACWVTLKHPDFNWADTLFFDMPAFLSVFYCGYCYLAIILKVKRVGEGSYYGLVYYPLILVICVFPLVLMDFYTIFFEPQQIPYYWVLVASVLWKSQGFFNGLAYGLTGGIISGCQKLRQKHSFHETTEIVSSHNYYSLRTESAHRYERTNSDLLQKTL